MKKLFTSVLLLSLTLFAGAAENLFDASKASLKEHWIAPNWTVDPNSNATYDAATGTIKVHIANQCFGQWQAQVKLNHNIEFDAAKRYKLSMTFNATIDVNGITVKMDDDIATFLETVDGLQPNKDFLFSAEADGKAGNNKTLVLDFGWAGACDITVSNISVEVVGDATPVEPVVYPAPAPAPTAKEADVYAIYSDAYATVHTPDEFNQGWWKNPDMEEGEVAAGDKVLLYTSNGDVNGCFGWAWGDAGIGDMSAYTTLHFDIYPQEAGSIMLGITRKNNTVNITVTPTLEAGKWNHITLDLKGQDITQVFQIGYWEFSTLKAFFLDNVYFEKPATEAIENTGVTKHADKIIENGQLVIVRDGVRYNVVGNVIR